ncbi:MAG: transposase [Bdellovibrionales bacterium]|nr:transposase [Bdellovibrionales bacterium]
MRVVPHSGHLVFQAFPDELAKHTQRLQPDEKIILILDNASWYKHSSLDWHHRKPCYLPPYAPDLIPIEGIWRVPGNNAMIKSA